MRRLSCLLLLLPVLIGSCKKEEGSTDTAGKGGNAVLKVNPNHHGEEIYGTVVYIKYNASDVPASYDDSVVAVEEGGKALATFSGLKKGRYYLFGKGYDSSIFAPVIGGAPYTIADESTQQINLPITEGD